MNKKKKPWILILIILLTVFICMVFTAVITKKLTSRESSNDKTKKEINITEENYPNAYIIANEGGGIQFIYQGKVYQKKGKTPENYQGVADIQIKNNQIKKVVQKPDTIEGILESYSEKNMEIENYGDIKRIESVPVYKCMNQEITQGDFSDLIVGASNVKYVLAQNVIQAILIDEETVADHIRVVIKNEDDIFFGQIFIKFSNSLQLSGENILEEKTEGGILDVKSYMTEHNVNKLKLSGESSHMQLCDSNGENLSLDYPGVLYCLRREEGLVLINEVEIEEYVRRVLPSEMPVKFELEALKAQAVCARTYSYSQLSNTTYVEYGANVDDSTAFQVYNKVEFCDKTNEAAKLTEGQTVTCQGEYITCYYYSTNPGVMEDFEIWNREDTTEESIPVFQYLKKNYETSTNPGDLSEERLFREFIDDCPDCYDKISPFYRWNMELDLSKAQDPAYGKIEDIKIQKRSTSGYVLALNVVCEEGERILTHENDIRTYLGKMICQVTLQDGTVRKELSLVPSACFYIASRDNQIYQLHGGGFGHGIGMSQYGANGMALEGKTYQEILSFYYQNTNITTK